MALLPIDYVLFAVYLTGTLALGLWLTRYVKSSGDYFLAGRRLPFWAIGMSIVVSDIGATDMIGLGSAGFREGLVVANWDWIGSFSAMVLAGLIFIPFYWRSGVFTVPEFLGRRYNEATRTLHSVIWLLILVFDVGIVFHATANLAGVLLGFPTEEIVGGVAGPAGDPVPVLTWQYWTVVWVIAAFVGVYMVGAGLSAVVLTDVVQLIVMLIGLGLFFKVATELRFNAFGLPVDVFQLFA